VKGVNLFDLSEGTNFKCNVQMIQVQLIETTVNFVGRDHVSCLLSDLHLSTLLIICIHVASNVLNGDNIKWV